MNRKRRLLRSSKTATILSVICAVLVLSVGTVAALAANSEGPPPGAPEGGVDAQPIITDETIYSTLPADVPRGGPKVLSHDGIAFSEGEPGGLMTSCISGVTRYSVDGGKTWSDTVPENYERFSNDPMPSGYVDPEADPIAE